MTSTWAPGSGPDAGVPELDDVDLGGTAVALRPLGAGDTARLVAFHEGLSLDTSYHRFFGIHRHLSEAEVHHFCTVDGHDRFALAAVADGRIVGVARMEAVGPPGTAELAFVLADAFQHRGLGKVMAQALLDAARRRGIDTVVADTMGDNDAMIHLLSSAGFPSRSSHRDGLVHLECRLGGHEPAHAGPSGASGASGASRPPRIDAAVT